MIQLLRLDLSTNYHCCHLLSAVYYLLLAQLTIDQTPAVSDKTFSARSHFRFFVKVWNSLPLSLPWEENVTAHCLGVVCCRRSSSRLSKAAFPLCPPAPFCLCQSLMLPGWTTPRSAFISQICNSAQLQSWNFKFPGNLQSRVNHFQVYNQLV